MLKDTQATTALENPQDKPSDPRKNDKCRLCVITTFHVLDMALGILLVICGVIGSLYLVFLGSVILLSVILGQLGMFTSLCKRNGLLFAGMLALAVAIMELVAGFILLWNKDEWVARLKLHQAELHLSDTIIEKLGKAAPAFFYLGLVLSLLEILRMFMLCNLRKDMILMDEPGQVDVGDLQQPFLSLDEESSESTFLPVDEEAIYCDCLYWSKGKSVTLGKPKRPNIV
mmetsp:Transcript_46449/g.68648  ORF Transcript_46449/g.68648 Transcript_46449/m.68648 type:complete len:229 (-) Transcript_46449:255-941(-)|eukprot:CAMPEP_0195518822 /NCGR_PEP_ID=MMETSP0794_2-20130614/13738_1 /TAXON_ID=515487 /ORGANISM="Stephanopyxis turris, Strain CCMP 815" /LENGTH=228 /DNA_ID=CAMNT_0040647851 /DNA_START=52 /DNA_END=738 /DNA_ORIENTATION=+